MLTTFIALCGFAFGAAGGVVSVPLWVVSMIGVVLIGISVILLHRKIIKLQHELGEL